MDWQDVYEDVITLDFEFVAEDGEQQHPICLVAKSLKTGEKNQASDCGGGAVPPTSWPRVFICGLLCFG